MKIDKITRNKNGKYKIVFDNKESITTYDDVILNNGILFKKELTSEELNKINIDDSYYETYNKTVKFISTKMRSKKEIIKFLEKKEITEDDREKIVLKLTEINLINDERFAKSYFQDRLHLSSDGPYKIKQELKNNDIKDDVIECIYDKLDQKFIYEKLDKLIQKKVKANHNKSNFILKQKIINDMINFGYEKTMILDIIEKRIVNNSDIINNEYRKLKNKLSTKFSDRELEIKIKTKLQQKGFSIEEINSVIHEDF